MNTILLGRCFDLGIRGPHEKQTAAESKERIKKIKIKKINILNPGLYSSEH